MHQVCMNCCWRALVGDVMLLGMFKDVLRFACAEFSLPIPPPPQQHSHAPDR